MNIIQTAIAALKTGRSSSPKRGGVWQPQGAIAAQRRRICARGANSRSPKGVFAPWAQIAARRCARGATPDARIGKCRCAAPQYHEIGAVQNAF